ncbi:unnamed protein product [Boreogadus saida]
MSVSAEESAVKVCVRVRPLIEREERATAEDSVPAPLYWKADRKSIHQLDDGVTTKSFSYGGAEVSLYTKVQEEEGFSLFGGFSQGSRVLLKRGELS